MSNLLYIILLVPSLSKSVKKNCSPAARGFQVIDPSNDEKMLKSRKNPGY